ncbi:putative bifunctional diguanylate cyclase/phosphodiesterase [Paenibacillus crassostreae]|uniref:Diguanylate cyclase n=1 Tax=Paenibacillus crassostreae TaxID=1763538 RepID=A0A167BAW7_9BACL|nr:bifunctional diguanylate cyclase/phosphodiesterase [Paenibacillus crassostreae]AOZ93011.1 hypothetical protein LPB68_12830 [Paenibacillus crassostreae]OAB71901.1 hypothetical protein PNBC_18060 [Paenibacillus crassostreae]
MIRRKNKASNPNTGSQLEPINKRTFSPVWASSKIAGVYFIIGFLWILLTDKIVSYFTQDSELIRLINMFKDWLFILMTALLIFGLILGTLNRIQKMEKKLRIAYKDRVSAYQNLEATYEEIIATEDELRQQYDQLIEQQHKLTKSEEKMHQLAYHDLLTGLPNQIDLYENGANKILEFSNTNVALMFIDIDNFKYINDTMGHEFGDRLIVKTSQRLISIVEQRGEVYRFGGDEFIILLHSIKNPDDVQVVAHEILHGFKKTIEMDNSQLHISISIGISIYPEHGNNIMELVKRADIAMHKAKEAGKDRILVFDYPMNDSFIERMHLEKQLFMAMENNEFELYYQPQMDLTRNTITGLEALLRWNNPELGEVSPHKFIKAAEDSHLIIPLGTWVLTTACTFLKKLHDSGLHHLTMSINISMIQLLQADFNEIVLDTIQTCGLDPAYLELEITESVLVESYDLVTSKLNELKKHNIKIALDDFGTGYSSLSYLTNLPISTLKIDKSFIDSIRTGTHQDALIEQIIIIGKRMNMCVIAEGVEQTMQLEYLQEQGCDKIQGYLYSKPLSAQNVIQFLNPN